MTRLPTSPYLGFPFRVGSDQPGLSERSRHVREQIEQVLLTSPGERVFRPNFGAGVRQMVFEPSDSALAQVTRKRLVASLSEALQGEVDPRTLEVEVETEGESVRVTVSYSLATIGHVERHVLMVGAGGQSHG